MKKDNTLSTPCLFVCFYVLFMSHVLWSVWVFLFSPDNFFQTGILKIKVTLSRRKIKIKLHNVIFTDEAAGVGVL